MKNYTVTNSPISIDRSVDPDTLEVKEGKPLYYVLEDGVPMKPGFSNAKKAQVEYERLIG